MNSKMKKLLSLTGAACLLALLMAVPATVWAQQAAGSMTGTVTDPSGSAVANASVTAHDMNQNTTWATKTNERGRLRISADSCGDDRGHGGSPGFQTQQRAAFAWR